MLRANKRECGRYGVCEGLKYNVVVVVKLTESENDVPGAELRSSTVEDLAQRDL